jgi:hypothetical protein
MTNKDWDLSDEYYCSNPDEKDLSLEDFITDDNIDHSDLLQEQTDELLKKTIEDVHLVLGLSQEGKSIPEIAAMTGLDEKYVYDIQVCEQGFHEDDEIAVAHLVLG